MPPSASDRPAATTAPATPVARVAVDVGLPHLDRPFDYCVTEEQAADAVEGARVRVRFAGRLVNGYILERTSMSAHAGTLSALDRVVSGEPVLTPEVAELARRVADHYAGTLADVLRLAVPPRHARTERAASTGRLAEEDRAAPATPVPGDWRAYRAGSALLDALVERGRPRAVVSVLPGADWPDMLARAATASLAGGRGAIVVAPDLRDVARIDAALLALLGPGHHVAWHTDHGASARYRRFLSVLRGQYRIVVGTRSAVFAPVHDLGLLVVWDDGDDLHAEPHAPYPHARDVALIRAHQHDAAVLLAGVARTAEAARLLRTGWAHEVTADRTTRSQSTPLVQATTDDDRDPHASARLPERAWRAVHEGLLRGPVLVSVPRRGYRPALACARCRRPARCSTCAGPLRQTQDTPPPSCGWCGQPAVGWRCPHCSSGDLRAAIVGDERTAEELGRAFPGVPVRHSGRGHVLAEVPAVPSLVIATPGAEPVVAGGYAAAVLLDTFAVRSRPTLRAEEEALRRWMNAAALVRPRSIEGRVVLVGDAASRSAQALIRWDPAGFAARELDDRDAAHLPPAWRAAQLAGVEEAVADMLARVALPRSAEVLGPVPWGPEPGEVAPSAGTSAVQVLIRVRMEDGRALSLALRSAAGQRSARRAAGWVRIQVDPVDLA